MTGIQAFGALGMTAMSTGQIAPAARGGEVRRELFTAATLFDGRRWKA
jgi:hypothetical protein